MTVTIIGTGFVGVVTAGVLASFGNTVYGLDVDEDKVKKLQKGVIPFYEPGLEELITTQNESGNLHFTTSYKKAISDSDVIMIAVGTPSAPDGQADLKYVVASAESMAPFLKKDAIVVLKSTVPPGTSTLVKKTISALTKTPFSVASMPEFLKEGTAVQDTLHPDRIVIGAKESSVIERLKKLHAPFNTSIVVISPESAQMAKYAANSYLATRITFINQIADLCEINGANIQEVISAIGLDKRIGEHYWYPGFGYGGSCFPKDVSELAAYSRSVGEQDNLLNKVHEINSNRMYKLLRQFEKSVGGWDGKKVAVLGLSFKKNTDDTREAPSTKIIPYLMSKGAEVSGYDPMAVLEDGGRRTENGERRTENGGRRTEDEGLKKQHDTFKQLDDINDAVKNADVIIAVVEWDEITSFDFTKTKEKKVQWFIDGRNQFDAQKMRQAGYNYVGIGC